MVSMLAAGVALLNALMVYVLVRVGVVVMERRPKGPGHLAGTSFAVWWFTLAGLQAGSVLDFIIQAVGGSWTLAAYMTYVQLLLLIIVAAIGGLLYYMVYVYTGRRNAWRIIAAAYTGIYILLVYYVFLAEPIAVTQGPLGTTLEYRYDLDDTLLARIVGIGLILPTLLAAIGYFSLYFRVEEPSQKFRIGAVGGSFIIWFGSSLLVGQLTDWSDTTAWRITSAFITLGSAFAVYTGFQPPAWMRKRFHLSGYGENA